MTRTLQIRLALREEGNFWNAYVAHADNMDRSMLIGSIAIGAARRNPEIKAAFQAVMQQVLADAVEDITGEPPTEWDIGPAPESERSDRPTPDEIEVTPEMAHVGACALFPDGEVFETSDELEVMTRVFRAMVTGRDPRLPSYSDLCALLGKKE